MVWVQSRVCKLTAVGARDFWNMAGKQGLRALLSLQWRRLWDPERIRIQKTLRTFCKLSVLPTYNRYVTRLGMLFFLSKSLILRKDFLKTKKPKKQTTKTIPSLFEKFQERSSLYMATPSNCQKGSPFRQMYRNLYPSLRLSEPSSSTHESTYKSKVYAFMFTDVRVKTGL